MNSVFVPLSLDGEYRQRALSEKLGQAELLSQLMKESTELTQAAMEMRCTLGNPVPLLREHAQQKLIVEAGDVLITMDMLASLQLLDQAGARFVGRYKTDRWYGLIVRGQR